MRSLGVPVHLIDNLPWRRPKSALPEGAVIEGEATSVSVEETSAQNVVSLPDHIKVKKKKK